MGAILVPRLLEQGYQVRVLDLFIFGEKLWEDMEDRSGLEAIKGDLRDESLLRKVLPGCDAVIHLACVSNDPSFELNPTLGRSINFDSFEPLVKISEESRVRRFIYASSSSVYGVSEARDVTEDHPLRPLTDYSRYKALCEPILLKAESPDFTPVVIRPATVCGYSPRQRLDLTVNILTNHAVHRRRIEVFGGDQLRPNIHIEDLVDLYVLLLEIGNERISGKVFNAGYENRTVREIAERVQKVVEKELPDGPSIEIVVTPTNDHRSYHISSEKIRREIGFTPKRTIEDAVRDLVKAFNTGKIPNAMTEARYYNIKTMQRIQAELEPGACEPKP